MQAITLPITLATTGGAAMIALWLGLRAGKARGSAKVSIGDGGNDALITRMRAQANYIEYAPFIVALIALLEFTTGTSTLLTDGSGAADFLGQGSCRFALIEAKSERAFAQRADAIGLRYDATARIEAYNFSQGRAVSVAIYRSEGTR